MVKSIQYLPSKTAYGVLIKGNIIAPGESPQHMFERVVDTLFSVEPHFRTPKKETKRAKEEFAMYMAAKMYTPGTPTLTNAELTGLNPYCHYKCTILRLNGTNGTV